MKFKQKYLRQRINIFKNEKNSKYLSQFVFVKKEKRKNEKIRRKVIFIRLNSI